MIELPEASVIARQIRESCAGRRITAADRGNAPHKFAFTTYPKEEYTRILTGRTVGPAWSHGWAILVPVEPGYMLMLGVGGERITLHHSADNLPAKRQLFLSMVGDLHLTVTVQGWGAVMLMEEGELPAQPYLNYGKLSPLAEEYTFEHWNGLFEALPPGDKTPLKAFLTGKPGVLGLGNGCLQDILFRAGIHPRRRAADLSGEERRGLYGALRQTLTEMEAAGGRDSEHDLYGSLGGYARIMRPEAVGRPCPRCGTPVEKINYMGGSMYFCPGCQV